LLVCVKGAAGGEAAADMLAVVLVEAAAVRGHPDGGCAE